MTVIASILYRDGVPFSSIGIDSAPSFAEPGDFVWIGLYEPSETELRTVAQAYGLHTLAVEDALKARQLPKIEVYGDQLFVIARTAFLAEDVIQYGQTAIFVGARFIITVRHGSARAHTTLRVQLEAAPSLLRNGVDYVLHAIIDFIVDGYMPIAEAIEEETLRMEQHALEHFLGREEIMRIFSLRRELIYFRRVLGPMVDIPQRLATVELPCIDKKVKPYFRDVLDHVRGVALTVDHLLAALNSVFEVSNLLEQQRQGAITRRLAAWAAILAVPTAMAGIYGMNFDYMPELRWHYGYPAVIATMVGVCLCLYVGFKRAKWL